MKQLSEKNSGLTPEEVNMLMVAPPQEVIDGAEKAARQSMIKGAAFVAGAVALGAVGATRQSRWAKVAAYGGAAIAGVVGVLQSSAAGTAAMIHQNLLALKKSTPDEHMNQAVQGYFCQNFTDGPCNSTGGHVASLASPENTGKNL